MAVLDVRVRDLQAGDFLLGSRQMVVHKPFETVKHPGKRVVGVKTSSGYERLAVWNPNTMMRILRETEPVYTNNCTHIPNCGFDCWIK